MQPNQPTATPPSNPYDFILNPQQPPKRSLFNLPSGKKGLLILAGGGILVVIIIFMGFSLLFGGSGETGQKLLQIAQTQTEIIRLTDDAKGKARSGATLNLATTVNLSVASSKNDLLPLVKKYGAKTDTKTLGLGRDSKADEQLAAALESSQYDSVSAAVINDQLKTYRQQLQSTYASLSKPAEKQVLKTAYDGVSLLIGQN